MKTLTHLSTFFGLTIILSLFSISSKAQNLLNNGTLSSGSNYWTSNGMTTEINAESIYGGASSSNQTAEIDAQAGLRQRVSGILKGYYYQLNFNASRRTGGGTPASVGLTVRIVGTSTNTVYYTNSKSYTNTSFGFVTEARGFFIPATVTDNNVYVEFIAYNNSTTLGVIVDNIQLVLLGSLPVKWGSFSGTSNKSSVDLSWTTAAEINNSYFVVEKAAGNNQFDSIGKVFPNANHTYRFVDNKASSEINMYRIRQVDIDGRSEFSKVISIRTGIQQKEWNLSPTQTNSRVTIQLSVVASTQINIDVVDLNGRVVKQMKTSANIGNNQLPIDVADLKTGIYYAVLRSTDNSNYGTKCFHKVD